MSKDDKKKLNDIPTLGSLASKSEVIKSDLHSDVQKSLEKADTALQSIPTEYITETELANKSYLTKETDPTVPDWAKSPTKPSYEPKEVGLGNVVNTGDSATPVSGGTTKFTTGGAYTELAKKVDKVDGKGLSTEDYTTGEKNKLYSIAFGAEVNVQSDWNQTDTTADDYIKNKPTNYVTTEQFEAALGSYINDIDALLGGD